MTPRYRRVADLFELTAMLLASTTGVTLDLIRNSIEAIEEEGTVSIVAFRGADGQGASFVVSDSGPGMPDELQNQLSDPPSDGTRSGPGLGLAIVRHIVEAHGGSLTIKSGEGDGTLVELELPERPEPIPGGAE